MWPRVVISSPPAPLTAFPLPTTQIYRERPQEYENTERISLVCSFVASVLAGRYAEIETSDGSGMNLMHIRYVREKKKTLGNTENCVFVCGRRRFLHVYLCFVFLHGVFMAVFVAHYSPGYCLRYRTLLSTRVIGRDTKLPMLYFCAARGLEKFHAFFVMAVRDEKKKKRLFDYGPCFTRPCSPGTPTVDVVLQVVDIMMN